jgi:hypothetical protein
MRWLYLMLAVLFPLSSAVAQTTATTTVNSCKIKNTSNCQASCAMPTSCKDKCAGCPSACSSVECWDVVWGDDGLKELWKDLSEKQRAQLLKSMKIEIR